MKRITNKARLIRLQQARERNLFRERARRKHKRRQLSRKGFGAAIAVDTEQAPPDSVGPRVPRLASRFSRTLAPPRSFELRRNTFETLFFFQGIEDSLNRNESVFIAMQDVETIDVAAIVVLLASAQQFRRRKVAFTGNLPRSAAARGEFQRSGFFEALFSNDIAGQPTIDLGNESSIVTHSSMLVDSVLSARLVSLASRAVFGEERRCPGVQRAIVELMQNTNNHAGAGDRGGQHWWLSMSPNNKRKLASFVFVDTGIGIFKSLDSKPSGAKWYGWRSIAKLAGLDSNARALRLILDGELHRTVTNSYFRGKGLPALREALERNQFSELFMLTNDVYADVSKGIFRRLPIEFSGTLIAWNLDHRNSSLPTSS